jgi:acyl dehydratase
MMPDNPSYKRTFEDFSSGQIIKHWPGKTITESDNNLFCLLTMNHHPLHSDVEYAKKHQHGRIVVAGPYVLSLVIGMTVADISGAAIANLEYEKIVHHYPVFIGDTIHATSTIIGLKSSTTKSDRGIVELETTAFNQDSKKVLTLQRKVLLPKR